MKVFSIIYDEGCGGSLPLHEIVREMDRRHVTIGVAIESRPEFSERPIKEAGPEIQTLEKAGARQVAVYGSSGAWFYVPEGMSDQDVFRRFDTDYLLVVGGMQEELPKLLVTSREGKNNFINARELSSGKSTGKSGSTDGTEADPTVFAAAAAGDDIVEICDLIEAKVFEKLPGVTPHCCHECGLSCADLCRRIVAGTGSRDECVVSRSRVKFFVDGREQEIVGFVQRLLENNIRAVARELDGYKESGEIVIKLG